VIVTRLQLRNVRAIEAAEFHFQRGFNLIVGVNGVGKTTVLEAISRGLAQAIHKSVKISTTEPNFSVKDIRHGAIVASITIDLEIGEQTLQVHDERFRSSTANARPGELASEVDVHASGFRRKGRLREAHRKAQETVSVETGPKFLPDENAFRTAAEAAGSQVLAVYYSTLRAHPSTSKARKQRATRPVAAAYVDAFTGRELMLSEFADWIHVLQETASERTDATPMLSSLNAAVRRFLPGHVGIDISIAEPKQLLIQQSERETFTAARLPLIDRQRLLQILKAVNDHMSTNWPPAEFRDLPLQELSRRSSEERAKVVREQMSRYMNDFDNLEGPLNELPFKIDDKHLTGEFGKSIRLDRLPRTLEVSQLSDGERGVLAVVLDLTRRLAQANPNITDPAANASAVVLIDELELHLHPKWQRQITHDLAKAFPLCQFIATTHSPQIIGEVEHQGIQIIAEGKVYSPTHSYGLDSSRVLEEVMDSDTRAKEVKDLLSEISRVIGRQQYDRGRELLVRLGERLGENDPDVTRLRTLLDFVEGKE
jgi:Predicted ATP-binding protein involved in virulence